MSASAAVRDLTRAPLDESAFHLAQISADEARTRNQRGRADQIKKVLRELGLTMGQVSVLTGMRYGQNTPYFIPPTFLYKQKRGITPHICQIAALSHITGHRFSDWMNVFGFDLKLILPLQLKIHSERTVLVTPDYSVGARDACFVPRNSRIAKPNGRYFFAKIGNRDAVVYPRLLPGSIVRADRYYSQDVPVGEHGDGRLWLVEHAGGLTCCAVERVDDEHVVLLPNRPPLSAWPLRLSREVRILGLVDLELRPRHVTRSEPACHPAKSNSSMMASVGKSGIKLSKLLRISRSRAGLTIRAAHEMTIRVARLMRNRDYGIALGLLSDYEAMNRLPRHVAKIMSLCIIYGVDFWELMEAGGIQVDDSKLAPLVPHDGEGDLRQSA